MAILGNLNPVKVYWHNPEPIFVAQVNLASPSYPIQDIPYDNVTTGAYTDLAANMFFTLGSAEGLDDYGRGRLRAVPTSTILKVGRSSQGTEDGQLSIVDNAYISVYLDFRVHAKIPVIGGDYNEYKDSDLAVGDLTEFPPPIANLGSDFAGSIDPDTSTLTVFFPGSNSIPVADGATITGYNWTAPGGTFVNGTAATDDDVYIEFPAGVYWVGLTVTDSNGKTHSGRRLVLADDPADSLCVSGMQVQNITRDQQGTTARLRVLQELPRVDYPDGAHVLIFEDRPSLDGVSRDHVLFTGWHQVDQASARASETHLQRDTLLTCVDAAGRLDSLPGFPQRVEVPTETDLSESGMNWGYMPAANMDKFLCYLIHWHSTAASVADFYPSGTWDEYPFVIFDSGGATLYEQLQRQASRIVPDHNFTCDRFGALRVLPNPQFQPVVDRTATVQNSLTDQSWSEISFDYTRPPRVHTTRGSALLTQTEWVIDEDDEKQLLTPVFAIAPGTAPGQGAREDTLGERLAKSQAALNDCVGHHHAHSNSRYSPIQVTLNLNADPWDFDPAAYTWVQLVVSAASAPQRGIDFVDPRCLPISVSIDYQYGEEATTWRGRVTLEMETIGLPALTEEQEEALPVGEQPQVPPPAIPPPDFGLIVGQELVAAINEDGYLYRTADFQTVSGSGGPTWEQISLAVSGDIYSWVVDPFSPGYLEGVGAINGWVVTSTGVYRLADLFGTFSSTLVHTFAVALGTSSVPAQEWRSIQASFGTYFLEGSNPWLLVVSHYRDATGHVGTWALRSLDGGATWQTETLISAFYDSGTDTEVRPIAVYTSPKTPGLAYAAAYSATTSPPVANAFLSTDWGETWSEVLDTATEDPIELLPRWGMWDDDAVYTLLHLGATYSAHLKASSPGNASVEQRYLISPPADTVRFEMDCHWLSSLQGSGNGASVYTFEAGDIAIGRSTLSGSYTGPTTGDVTSGIIVERWTRNPGLGAWEADRPSVEAASPASKFDGSHVRNQWTVSLFGGGDLIEGIIHNNFRITEIELEDGTIYTPVDSIGNFTTGNLLGGDFHFPWMDNDDEQLVYFGYAELSSHRHFELHRKNPDGTISNISPIIDGVSYGINHYGFAVRCYDSDRSYVVAGVTGNDVTSLASGDQHAIVISDDGGDTWVTLVAPAAGDAYRVAFAGDSEQILYLWGPEEYIAYSADFGATIDDRVGNLSTFTPGIAIGLAGGPTP